MSTYLHLTGADLIIECDNGLGVAAGVIADWIDSRRTIIFDANLRGVFVVCFGNQTHVRLTPLLRNETGHIVRVDDLSTL